MLEGVAVGLARLGTPVVTDRSGLVHEFALLSMLARRMGVVEGFAGRSQEGGNPGSHGCSTRRMGVGLGVAHRMPLGEGRSGGKGYKVVVLAEDLDQIHSYFAVAAVVEWAHR